MKLGCCNKYPAAFLIAVLLASLSSNAFAAESCWSNFTRGDISVTGYSTRVRNALAKDPSIVASMIVMPSFKPESAVAILHHSNSKDEWVARYTLESASIWASDSEGKLPSAIKTREIAVDKLLAERIVSLWKVAIDQSVNAIDVVADGVTYLFSVNDNQAYTLFAGCGLPMHMVESGEALREAIVAKSHAQSSAALKRVAASLDLIERDTNEQAKAH